MAMVECKECAGQISQNAETCPHCGDVIKEPKAKFSLVNLIHKVSVSGRFVDRRNNDHHLELHQLEGLDHRLWMKFSIS